MELDNFAALLLSKTPETIGRRPKPLSSAKAPGSPYTSG